MNHSLFRHSFLRLVLLVRMKTELFFLQLLEGLSTQESWLVWNRRIYMLETVSSTSASISFIYYLSILFQRLRHIEAC